MRRTASLCFLALAMTVAGCSDHPAPEPDAVSNPGLDGPSDVGIGGSPAVPTDLPATTKEPTPPTTEVTVDVVLRVAETSQVDALVRFVRAHARSMNTGYPTSDLETAVTADQLAHEAEVIEWAASQGYGVPDRPRIAVVAGDSTTNQAQLDVCLWLPSTEFVSRATGLPVDESVPATWRPARATLARHNDAWRVDRLADADKTDPISCGGLT